MLNKHVLFTVSLLLPLFFLSYFPNIFGTAKMLLLLVTLSLIVLGIIVSLLQRRTLHLSASPLRFGLLAFTLALLLNLATHPAGRTEALVGPAGSYLLLSLWAYLLSLWPAESSKKSFFHGLLASSSLLSVHSLLQLTLLAGNTALPLFMQARSFTPTGSPLTTFCLLLLGFLLSLTLSLKSSSTRHKSLLLVLTAFHAVALIALGSLLLPGQELTPLLLPFKASWNIALDAMKTLSSFFFGVGLVGFADFAARVKPLFLNSTVFWNQSLTGSGTELLQILTTLGVVGLLAYLSLPFLAFTHGPRDEMSPALTLLTLSGLLLLIFLPASLPLQFVIFSGLGLLAAQTPHNRSLNFPTSLTLALILVGVLSFTWYQAFRILSGELAIERARVALSKNDGKTVYDQSLRATQQVPRLASYHLSFSQVNMSLASALSQKKDLTDTDRENISKLISQAISEGKLAITLNPSSTNAWQNLGLIYRNLINVATGSDQFAISAYAQAVSLDPANAPLRIEYGGLLYQLKLYERAKGEFQTAIQLKRDYPNAYYNLAKLLETTGDYSNAYLALQKAISLLGPDSPDLARATSELDALKPKVPRSEAKTPSEAGGEVGQSSISAPSPLPSPLPGGPLELPVETPTPSL